MSPQVILRRNQPKQAFSGRTTHLCLGSKQSRSQQIEVPAAETPLVNNLQDNNLYPNIDNNYDPSPTHKNPPLITNQHKV